MSTGELMELLTRLRKHQRCYFETKSPDALRAAKECERKLDAILQRWHESKQQQLFT